MHQILVHHIELQKLNSIGNRSIGWLILGILCWWQFRSWFHCVFIFMTWVYIFSIMLFRWTKFRWYSLPVSSCRTVTSQPVTPYIFIVWVYSYSMSGGIKISRQFVSINKYFFAYFYIGICCSPFPLSSICRMSFTSMSMYLWSKTGTEGISSRNCLL